MRSPYLFRELDQPHEVVSLLRLRHQIYFVRHDYGATKPLGLDLTAYDHRSRVFGLFRGDRLVGGLRLVFRCEQPLALAIRAVRAVVEDVVAEQASCELPSEAAFDLAAALGLRRGLVDVEVGRLVADRSDVGSAVVFEMMVATLAVLHLTRVRYYLYACAVTRSERYASVTKPRWLLQGAAQSGIGADGFVFPTLSCAGIAAAEDSPYFPDALRYADELAQTGSIVLDTRSA